MTILIPYWIVLTFAVIGFLSVLEMLRRMFVELNKPRVPLRLSIPREPPPKPKH